MKSQLKIGARLAESVGVPRNLDSLRELELLHSHFNKLYGAATGGVE